MRDPARVQRIAGKLARAWALYPDMRLSQLVLRLAPDQPDLFHLEDDQLEALLDQFLHDPPFVNLGTDDRPLYARSAEELGQTIHRVARETEADLTRGPEDLHPDDPRRPS